MNKESNIFWVDLETTGLLPNDGDLILEVAVIKTDYRLQEITRFSTEVKWDFDALKQANACDVVLEMHKKTGLTERLKSAAMSLCEIEQHLLTLVDGPKNKNYLAGSSIHFDASFLCVGMPKLFSMFSHRLLDVSSMALAFKIFAPDVVTTHISRHTHRALSDIEDSLDLIKLYGKYIKLGSQAEKI
jgi:oligoribonuclease